MPEPAKTAIGTTEGSGPPEANPSWLTPHRLYHLVSFGSTALLLLLVASTRAAEIKAVAATILLGTTLEITQYAISHGVLFEWWDIRDDTLGALAAYLLLRWPAVRTVLVSPD